MKDEADKIERIDGILQAGSANESLEAVSLALSISDEEDRNWQLFSIIRWMIKNGDWQKAFGTAQLISEGYEKSEALRLVADYLGSVGHLEKAFSVFAEAERAVYAGERLSAWQQAELLHKIARSLHDIKAIYKADEIWAKAVSVAKKGEEITDDVQESLDCSSVLAEIAEHLAAEGRIERALSIAQNIKNIGKRERALNKISELSSQIKKVA